MSGRRLFWILVMAASGVLAAFLVFVAVCAVKMRKP
jgi:hypothetical protein